MDFLGKCTDVIPTGVKNKPVYKSKKKTAACAKIDSPFWYMSPLREVTLVKSLLINKLERYSS